MNKVKLLVEADFSNHQSVVAISNNWTGEKNFEVQTALEKLNPDKAAGCDSIPPKLLKLAAAELAPSLTKIYNSCINQGCWPQSWKKGEWSPIFKKDEKLDNKIFVTMGDIALYA